MLSNPHRRYTTSGRAAIALVLRGLQVGPGDRVLVPTYHCPTMIAPVTQVGAQPVFYPIRASGGVDLEWLGGTPLPGVRAVLAAHYFGVPQPMAGLRAFCDAHRIALIEDCAHAFFGELEGVPVGATGEFAIASLPKFFPTPEGGLISSATRSLEELDFARYSWVDEVKAAADALEIGAAHGRFPGLNALLDGTFRLKRQLRASGASNGAPGAGGKSDEGRAGQSDPRLDSLSPAMVARWISKSVCQSRIVEDRRRNYAELSRRLSGIRGARALFPALPKGATPYVFPLYVDEPAASYQRLRSEGIPIFRWDELWPGTPVLEGDHGLDWADRVFQVGCHQDLSPSDIEAIADTVRAVVEA
jgi:perosamine synthetase